MTASATMCQVGFLKRQRSGMTVLRNENRKALQGSRDIEEQGVKGVHEPVGGGAQCNAIFGRVTNSRQLELPAQDGVNSASQQSNG